MSGEDLAVRENLVTRRRKPAAADLATPEELEARKRKAAADAQADLAPRDALVLAHDQIGDDGLAERIAAHPDRDIFLALWRRILAAGGEREIEDKKPAGEEPSALTPADKALSDAEAEIADLKAQLARQSAPPG
jgi:hypothetical protein